MKELLTHLLQGIEITGMYADETASFRDLLEKISQYIVNGDGAVKEWLHPTLEDNYARRHRCTAVFQYGGEAAVLPEGESVFTVPQQM